MVLHFINGQAGRLKRSVCEEVQQGMEDWAQGMTEGREEGKGLDIGREKEEPTGREIAVCGGKYEGIVLNGRECIGQDSNN